MTTGETPKDPFDLADYYDCREDTEHLDCESPEEAIERYLDGCWDPGCDPVQIITARSPITVRAFTRTVVPPGSAKRWAIYLADNLNELWNEEEYADPDGDDGPADAEFTTALTALVEQAIGRKTVWGCESSGKRVFSAEEAIALMREHSPEWFETGPSEPEVAT